MLQHEKIEQCGQKGLATPGQWTRGQSLSKITMIFQISLAKFKFQLHFMQISYLQVLLYFKFCGKSYGNLACLILL